MNDATIWDTVTGEEEIRSPIAIRLLKGNFLLRTIRLEPDITYIGRMPENHIVIDDPKASRSHARIVRQGGDDFQIEDQDSENGIQVNGKKVPAHLLAIGDRIVIGGHTLEVIHASAQVQPAAREEQLEAGENDEWRMDRTISVSSEQVQSLHLARMKTAEKKSANTTSTHRKAPILALTLTVGDRTFSKEIVFDKGRKRDGSGKPNELEVKVEIGNWILEKKIPL